MAGYLIKSLYFALGVNNDRQQQECYPLALHILLAFNGSGFPTPSQGLRRVSLIKRLILWRSFLSIS
jgi:hypothetical protein